MPLPVRCNQVQSGAIRCNQVQSGAMPLPTRCKCKACDFCPSRLDSGIACQSAAADDSPTHKCEPFCAMAHAEAHCDREHRHMHSTLMSTEDYERLRKTTATFVQQPITNPQLIYSRSALDLPLIPLPRRKGCGISLRSRRDVGSPSHATPQIPSSPHLYRTSTVDLP